MKYFVVLTFLLEIILSGCSFTEGSLKLEGKVVDRDSDVPVPNKTIIVLTAKNVADFDSGYVIGHFITDSLGGFTYRIQKAKNVYFYNFYIVSDGSHASANNVLGVGELNRGGKSLTFKIRKLTDLNIRIVRSGKPPDNDILYVTWKSDKVDGKTLYPYKVENNGLMTNNQLKWVGDKVNSVIKAKVYADKQTVIRFNLFRNREFKEFVITVFCKADVNNSVLFKY